MLAFEIPAQDLKLPGSKVEFRVSEVLPPIAIGGEEISFCRPVDLNVVAENVEGTIVVKGKVASAVRLKCDRCLEEFVWEFELPYEEVFSRQEAGPNPTGAAEAIDLEDSVISTILLDLPMKRLCREECAGLCSICGANLNRERCGCQARDVDVRLQPLAKLLEATGKED